MARYDGRQAGNGRCGLRDGLDDFRLGSARGHRCGLDSWDLTETILPGLASRAPGRNDALQVAIFVGPLACGGEEPQPASDQKAHHEKQAPNRKEKQGQNSGVPGFGLQQPFDDTNRSE